MRRARLVRITSSIVDRAIGDRAARHAAPACARRTGSCRRARKRRRGCRRDQRSERKHQHSISEQASSRLRAEGSG